MRHHRFEGWKGVSIRKQSRDVGLQVDQTSLLGSIFRSTHSHNQVSQTLASGTNELTVLIGNESAERA